MKPRLYLETTVPSYDTAQPVRDIIVLAHQAMTRTWWEQHVSRFEVSISPVVLEEVRRGDPAQVRLRLAALTPYPVLEATPAIEQLAQTDITALPFPAKALRDAAHLAFAWG